jgi:hypothetical protein
MMPRIYLCNGVKGKRANGWLTFDFLKTDTLYEFQVDTRIYTLRSERFNFSPIYVCAGDQLKIWYGCLHNFMVIRRLDDIPFDNTHWLCKVNTSNIQPSLPFPEIPNEKDGSNQEILGNEDTPVPSSIVQS